VQKPLHHWGKPSGGKTRSNATSLAGMVQRLMHYSSELAGIKLRNSEEAESWLGGIMRRDDFNVIFDFLPSFCPPMILPSLFYF
jgi:hypothetical protein